MDSDGDYATADMRNLKIITKKSSSSLFTIKMFLKIFCAWDTVSVFKRLQQINFAAIL